MGMFEDALNWYQDKVSKAEQYAEQTKTEEAIANFKRTHNGEEPSPAQLAKELAYVKNQWGFAEDMAGSTGGMTRFGKAYGTVADRILKKEMGDHYLYNDSTQITNRLMNKIRDIKNRSRSLSKDADPMVKEITHLEENVKLPTLKEMAVRNMKSTFGGISPQNIGTPGEHTWKYLENLAGGNVIAPRKNLGSIPNIGAKGEIEYGANLTQGQRKSQKAYMLEKAQDSTRREYKDLQKKFDETRDSAELGAEIKNDLKKYFYNRGGTISPRDIPEVSGPYTEVDPAGWGYLDLYKLAKNQQKRFQKDFINQERKQLEQELASKLAAREKASGLNFQLPEEVALQQKELSKYARKFEKNKSDLNKGFTNLFEAAKNYTPIVEEVAPPSKMGSYVDEFIANKQPVNELTTPKGWGQIGDSPVTKTLDENGWPVDQYSEYLKRIGATDKSSITGPKILTKAQRDAFNKWKGKK